MEFLGTTWFKVVCHKVLIKNFSNIFSSVVSKFKMDQDFDPFLSYSYLWTNS